MEEFKDRFKLLRLEKGLTQEEIGVLLGYSESNMSLYESGKRQPKTANDYIKIADFFNVSLDYLLGRSDIKNIATEDYKKIDKESISELVSILDKSGFVIRRK